MDGAVIHSETPFGHHFFNVPITERIREIPANTLKVVPETTLEACDLLLEVGVVLGQLTNLCCQTLHLLLKSGDVWNPYGQKTHAAFWW